MCEEERQHDCKQDIHLRHLGGGTASTSPCLFSSSGDGKQVPVAAGVTPHRHTGWREAKQDTPARAIELRYQQLDSTDRKAAHPSGGMLIGQSRLLGWRWQGGWWTLRLQQKRRFASVWETAACSASRDRVATENMNNVYWCDGLMLRSERTDNTSNVWLLTELCRNSIQPTQPHCHWICQISRKTWSNVSSDKRNQRLFAAVCSTRRAPWWSFCEWQQSGPTRKLKYPCYFVWVKVQCICLALYILYINTSSIYFIYSIITDTQYNKNCLSFHVNRMFLDYL